MATHQHFVFHEIQQNKMEQKYSSPLHAVRIDIVFETVYICIVLNNDIKWISVVTVKKKKKSLKISLQHNPVLLKRQGTDTDKVMLCTDKDNKNPFCKSLRAKCISKFILFQISERLFLVQDVILATGTRTLAPSQHIHREQFTLIAMASLLLPAEFSSGKPKK